MDLSQFKESLSADAPPPEICDLALLALWHAAKNNWCLAHELAQSDKGETGAWVHAYLHRVEGDLSNARYWYRRASKSARRGELTTEWNEIVAALL